MLCAYLLLTAATEINGVVLRTNSLSALVVAAPLERYLDDLVPHTHIKLTPAVQDQQASDRLPLPRREQLELLQEAASRGLIERGKHFSDRPIIWRRRGRGLIRGCRERVHRHLVQSVWEKWKRERGRAVSERENIKICVATLSFVKG